MYAMRSYQQGVQRLVAACDEELLGSRHIEGKFRLDVTPDFYDGMRVEQDVLISQLQSATIANLVGPRAVELAIDAGLVDPGHVLHVDGVPHAQFLVLEA